MSADLTAEMRALYEHPDAPRSLAEIGEVYGMSKQAVSKRLKRAGVPLRSAPEARALDYELWVKNHEAQIAEALAATLDVTELAAKLDAPRTWVQRVLVERFGSARLGQRPASRPEYDRADLLVALRRVHDELGGTEPLRASEYDTARGGRPASATVVKYFGSWSAACTAARVPFVERPRRYDLAWSATAAAEALREYLADCRADDLDPLASDYEERWRADHDGPCLATLRRIFGSWRDALWAVLRP